ncbi:MAG: flagellar basal body-associated FliL family protein [Pseudomonadota bacterium]
MTTEEGKKKGLNPLIAVGGAAVVAAISGAAAFTLAPSAGGETAEAHSDEHGGEKGHGDEMKKAAKGHDDGHGGADKKKKAKKDKKGKTAKKGGGPVYVDIEPLIISLGPEAAARRLKISIVIESDPAYADKLVELIPRFRDVLNTYLRAVDARDFESPASMSRIRAHIARRLRIVAPEDSIEGVLVTDFILD